MIVESNANRKKKLSALYAVVVLLFIILPIVLFSAGTTQKKLYPPAQITDLTMLGVDVTTRMVTLQWTAVGAETTKGTGRCHPNI